jgi:hypothetical protein
MSRQAHHDGSYPREPRWRSPMPSPTRLRPHTIERLAEEIEDGAEFSGDHIAGILKAVEAGLIGKAIAR